MQHKLICGYNGLAIRHYLVLPGGKHMISSLTFPEYFEKEKNNNVIINPALDIELFGTKIAKEYDITVRFVGEEPMDMITRQYNEHIKEKLPLYGIDVIEIPRKMYDNQVISASLVRKYIVNKEYDKIRKIVPESTYNFIINQYNQ